MPSPSRSVLCADCSVPNTLRLVPFANCSALDTWHFHALSGLLRTQRFVPCAELGSLRVQHFGARTMRESLPARHLAFLFVHVALRQRILPALYCTPFARRSALVTLCTAYGLLHARCSALAPNEDCSTFDTWLSMLPADCSALHTYLPMLPADCSVLNT